MKGKKIVKCAYCNKEKEIFFYQWNRSKNKLFFCDNTCLNKFYPKKKIKYCWTCGEEEHDKNGICKSGFFLKTDTFRKLGFDLSTIGSTKIFEEYEKLKDKIENMYYNEEKSAKDIQKAFNINTLSSVYKLLDFLHIKCKCHSIALTQVIKNGKFLPPKNPYNTFKQGWHTSWEGENIYYRSSYELDYMKELDEAKISYQGEKYLKFEYYDTQLKKNRIAFPDFYLPESNTIVEIKSTWSYNPQNMIDKVKAYKEAGYNFKLILEHKETNI